MRRAEVETVEGKGNVYSVEDFLNEMNSLPHVKLSKEVTDGIISTAKSNRPLPKLYMSKKEISSHLALFDEGAVKIQSRESYEQATKLYGSNIGDPKTGTYVLPKNVVDKAVEASNGNPRVLEELLGLEIGYLGEKPIIIKISEIENIRVPSGKEAGAWQGFWEPGGYTQGGIPEAVVDQIKSSNYTVSDIY